MNIEEVKETFEFMDEWEDRYRFIIDLGRKLPEFDESDQTEENRVHGCTSKVWMVYTKQDDKIIFKGDSDAHIVKGLVSIILMIFSGKTPKDIIDLDAREILTDLGLSQHLSPSEPMDFFQWLNVLKQ